MISGVQRIWLTPDFSPSLLSSHHWGGVSLMFLHSCWKGKLECNGLDVVIPKPIRISWET